MSTVQEILSAIDKLAPEEVRIVKIGVESRLDEDDDPALLAALQEAIANADAHPAEGKSVEELGALIPNWIWSNSGSRRDSLLRCLGQSRRGAESWQYVA